MADLTVPDRGTPEYLWWERGALAEADARDTPLTDDQREVRDLWDLMCRHRNNHGSGEPVAETVAALAGIFWAGQPWHRRIRLAWRAIR